MARSGNGKHHKGRAPAPPLVGAPEEAVLVAEIGAPHGVRGLVRLKTFTEDPASLLIYPLYDKKGRRFELRHLQPGPKGMVAGFKGVNDRNGAETLTNVQIFTSREALPELDDEDDFYIADLIGLSVQGTDGAEVGTIRSVQNFGAGDLLDIVTPEGKSDFLPFTHAFVPTVSIKQKTICIDPPEGFLAPAGPRPAEDVDGEEE